MSEVLPQVHAATRWGTGVRWVCVLLLVAGLWACTAPVAPGVDLVTASDETDRARRARIRLELAVGYFEKGQTTVALDEIKQSLIADPGYADAFNLRGLIYMRLNEPVLAEDSFRRAIELNPKGAGGVQHNYGWLLCQLGRLADAERQFSLALNNPNYGERAKTWMSRGLCQMGAGQVKDAEASLQRSYELDPGNPVVGYNLALLLFRRDELTRAQFMVRRINQGEYANAETLWLGIRIDKRLGQRESQAALAAELRRRFPQSPESSRLDRGAFDE